MIKFNKPFVVSRLPNFKNLDHYSSGGTYNQKCQQWLIKELKCKEALMVHSCTAALEMCALLLNIKNKDEIIMPSYTFVSTANAFVMMGGKPVFVDIDPDTCNIDPSKIEQAITKKTKAIVVVHYAGVSCDMDSIIKIAKQHKLYLIEDAAQAILSTYKGKPLGSIGDLATLSFHETKNIHCGEGGALLINNPKFIKRAKILRDKGTNRNLFDQNIVKKYTWVDYGSSYGLSEINAAFLSSQLSKAKKITKKRRENFFMYQSRLKNLAKNKKIKIPFIPKNCFHNGHIYYLHVKKGKRAKLIEYLKKRGINTVFHYVPLHLSHFGKKKCKTIGKLFFTTNLSKSLLRLPMHYVIKKNEIRRVCDEIEKFFK